MHFNGATEQCRFFIVEDLIKALHGWPDLLHLGLIIIHDSVLNPTGSVGEIDLAFTLNKRPAIQVWSYLKTLSLTTDLDQFLWVLAKIPG